MEYLIVVFLLFVAVLAFGWFYLQRAKARDVAEASMSRADQQPPSETPSA